MRTGTRISDIPRTADGYAAIGPRPRSDERAGLAVYISQYSDGRCVVCGDKSDKLELGHLVPGGRNCLGFVPGNIGAMCRGCNGDAKNADLSVLVDRFALPECIPDVWPDRATLVDLGRQRGPGDDVLRARARRLALGLPF